MGEPQVVAGAVPHPLGQDVPLFLQFAAPGRAECDAGLGDVPEVFLLLGEQFRLDGVVACLAGSIGCLLQGPAPGRSPRRFEEFFESWFTRAARSATCACKSATSTRSAPGLRLQLRDARIPPGQQVPQSRVRCAQPGDQLIRSGGQDDTPSRPAKHKKPCKRPGHGRDLSSYLDSIGRDQGRRRDVGARDAHVSQADDWD